MDKKIFLTFLVGIFLVTSVSALTSIGTFKQGANVTFIQTCATCTYNNVTYVAFPNSTTVQINAKMNQDGSIYRYFFNQTSAAGTYNINGIGDLNGVATAWVETMSITPTGQSFSGDSGSAFIYSILVIILFALDIGLGVVASRLRFGNPHNEEGEYIGVSLQKYGKILLIAILWGLVLLTLNLMNAAAQSIVGISQFAGIIGGIFSVMLAITPIWVFGVIIFIAVSIWKDANLFTFLQQAHDQLLEADNE